MTRGKRAKVELVPKERDNLMMGGVGARGKLYSPNRTGETFQEAAKGYRRAL